MKSILHVQLNASPEQVARLRALQVLFAAACNALSPLVQQTRCWNRVTLHHLAYRSLREQFPQIGSQMVCNAIYSVSRMSRIVFQHPGSPWQINKLGDRALPLLQFLPNAPVYFDRHTLSLKNGRISMYTLDGRMHFDIDLSPADEARFHSEKLREVMLSGQHGGYRLSFCFSPATEEEAPADGTTAELPEYMLVKDDAALSLPAPALFAPPALLPRAEPALMT